MVAALLLMISYLLGAFPSAYVMGRIFKKVDIREAGSGNVGGMNVFRVAGLLPGILTVLLDGGKGALALALAGRFAGEQPVVLACGFLVVLGHNYNLFLRFRGGKGLATTIGVFLVLSPLSILYTLLAALLLTLLLRDANTAFGTASLLIPLILFAQYRQVDWVFFGLALAAIITLKHLPDFRAYRGGRRQLAGKKG